MVKRAHKQLDVWREGVVLATYVYQMRFLQNFKQAYFIVLGLLNNGVQGHLKSLSCVVRLVSLIRLGLSRAGRLLQHFLHLNGLRKSFKCLPSKLPRKLPRKLPGKSCGFCHFVLRRQVAKSCRKNLA